jgi:hypothetical protein
VMCFCHARRQAGNREVSVIAISSFIGLARLGIHTLQIENHDTTIKNPTPLRDQVRLAHPPDGIQSSVELWIFDF